MTWRTDPREADLWDGRQASRNRQGIEPSHVARYTWAIERLAKRFPDGALVLDAACGCGYGSKMLAEAGHKVVGVDVSPPAIAYARSFYADPGVMYVHGDLLELILPEVDAVVSFETVEHVNRDRDLLTRFRAAAPVLLVSVPNADVYPLEGPVARHHWRHYEDLGFRDLLAETKFGTIVSTGSLDKWETIVSEGRTDKRFMVYEVEAR